jgi:hypothetical protein
MEWAMLHYRCEDGQWICSDEVPMHSFTAWILLVLHQFFPEIDRMCHMIQTILIKFARMQHIILSFGFRSTTI